MPNQNETDRPKIKEIIITFQDEPSKIISTKDLSAIFFDEKGIQQILGEFYNNSDKKMSKDEAGKRFGEKTAKELFKNYPTDERKIDSDFLLTVWNTPNNDNKRRALIMKDQYCFPI